MTYYAAQGLGNSQGADRSALRNSSPAAKNDYGTSITSWIYAGLFVLASMGYPLAGALTTLYAQGSQSISFGYRGLVIALSALLFLVSIFRGRLVTLSVLVVVFFVAGLARLYHDNFIAFIPDADRAGLYFTGTVLVPALVLGVCRYYYDARKFLIMVFGYNSLVCLLITYINLTGAAGAADISKIIDGRLFYEALNGTTIAYAGFFAIMSGYLLLHKSTVIFKMAIVLVSALGLQLMALAASRGPWIAFTLSIGYIAMLRRNKYLTIAMIIAAISFAFLLSDSALESLKIFERFSTVGVDQSSSERLFSIQSSLNGMIEFPFWGIAYVDPVSLFYPHNLVVESGMALGVGGAALMLMIQYRIAVATVAFGKGENTMLGIFTITVLTGAYLSGSIWQSADFWCVAALSLGLMASTTQAPLSGWKRSPFSAAKIARPRT
jgi:O-Antigen ligase